MSLIRATAARSVSVTRLHKPKCRRPLTACGLSEQEELQQTHERGQGQPHSRTMQSSVLYSKPTFKKPWQDCALKEQYEVRNSNKTVGQPFITKHGALW